ncbi:MAG: 50S ribosomal protein L5 [Patescibacteria group bacterium]
MLKEKYKKIVIPEFRKRMGYKNDFAVPKITKVVINTGIGKLLNNVDPSKRESLIKSILGDMMVVCGQRPVLTVAKRAISVFKTREGAVVGIKVTLRKGRAFEFLERLINIALPRSRDFRGIPLSAVDKGGVLTIGVKEHIIFPEIYPEKSKIIFGLEANVVSNAKNKNEAITLFKLMGFPLKEK